MRREDSFLKTEKIYTISELNNIVRGLIKEKFPQRIWICGEIQDFKPSSNRRHIYFNLAQKHPEVDEIIAKANAVIWESLKPKIMHRLSQAEANFELKNDIEVNGRKISGTGGTFEGNAFLFQGTLLTDFDVDTMFRALRIPIEKLKDKELQSARERVTCLKWELDKLPSIQQIKQALIHGFEEEFKIKIIPRKLTDEENSLFQKQLAHFQSEKWVYSIRKPLEHRQILKSLYKTPGGLIRTSIIGDIANKRIQAILITGDFFAYPKRTILDLEGMLKDAELDKSNLETKIKTFFKDRQVEIPGTTPDDFIVAINKAVDKIDYVKLGIPYQGINRIYTVLQSMDQIPKPPVLLLPYCSKLVECKFRHTKGCSKCNECTIGDAYYLAEKHNITPITIQSFEDLMETLAELKGKGVKSFIGSCCEAFFIKHFEDFVDAGLPGVLVDIDSTTCYDLEKVKEAELGSFEGQTHLNLSLLEKVLQLVT